MQFLILLLAAADLSGLIGEYLKAAPGTPEERTVIGKLHVYYDADPAVVEDAIRHHLDFPPADPGLRMVKIPLTGLEDDEQAPERNDTAIWVPDGYDPQRKWPVMFVMHGSMGLADEAVRAMGNFADEHGLILLGPQDMLARGGGGWMYSGYEHAAHVQALTFLKRNYNVDDSRVFLFGGSRGGHGVWDLATSWPDLFAGAIPVLGGPHNVTFRLLPNLQHVPLLDLQGGQDQPGLVQNLEDAFRILEDLGYDATLKIDPESAHFYPVDWKEVWAWMELRRRPSHPREIVRVAVRDDRSRAHWIEMAGVPRDKYERPPATKIPRDRPVDREEMVRLIRKNYEGYTARVEGKIEGNTVSLTVQRAPKLVLWLNDELVNLDDLVTIKVNGRAQATRSYPRSLETLLSRVRETGDREMLYPVRIELHGAR
jgi:hypothetical protein